MNFYAHTHPDFPNSKDAEKHWEPLFTPFGDSEEDCQRETCEKCRDLSTTHGHLNKVAFWTAKFASEMFAKDSPESKSAHTWGYLAGLWHDLGKFAPDWQTYLASKADPHTDDVSGKVDHSTAGAQHAATNHLLGHLIAYPIAGHHSGLLDAESNQACQKKRLTKSGLADWSNAPGEILSYPLPALPAFLKRDAFSLSFYSRMIFSCLVDADFLATEAFMNPSQAKIRNQTPHSALSEISALIDAKIDGFGIPTPSDKVNFQRRIIVEDCRTAAAEPTGIFSLTVPTGGGKTLSSLNFALRHALAHGQQRVIYVVPYTSIIEQNAEEIRKILSPLQTDRFTSLIEHHSSLSPEKETTQSRLAAENWDAPIIITTAVQFYESLYTAKTSRCRKLHHIANSVVILDEAQCLPADFLKPCLRVIQELADHYHTTTVLCTATQPAVHFQPEEFEIGLKDCREIIADTQSLFDALKRVEIQSLGDLPDSLLAPRLADHPQVLCIVNRRKHAQQLFQMLGQNEGNYHLSALMCPEHRSEILTEIRQRLRAKRPTRVISTQLIEVGVDVDFPVVYRALTGLDSIAQAAGRCNREGKLPTPGTTYIFRSEHQKAEVHFRETAQITHQLIELHPDLLSQKAIHAYFDLYYHQRKNRWDAKGILNSDSFRLGDKTFPFVFQFKTVAENFRLIEDHQVPVIIPHDEKANALIAKLKNTFQPLTRDLFRGLQRYTVQIPRALRDANVRSFESLRDDQFHVLISTDLNYSKHFGLCFEGDFSNSQFLQCDG
jgi:CRISPR-associated endonuclease/helicase Cas3